MVYNPFLTIPYRRWSFETALVDAMTRTYAGVSDVCPTSARWAFRLARACRYDSLILAPRERQERTGAAEDRANRRATGITLAGRGRKRSDVDDVVRLGATPGGRGLRPRRFALLCPCELME
jgi:hypothetical protein